jgi:HlyD family secretion protein
VMRVSLQVMEGNRAVFIALDSPVPSGVDPHAVVEGTIQVAKLENVIYMGRPVSAKANSQGRIFKIIDNGKEAEQVHVEYGRVSVSTVQVLSGLKPGDTVILSYMTPYEQFNRLEIKPAS